MGAMKNIATPMSLDVSDMSQASRTLNPKPHSAKPKRSTSMTLNPKTTDAVTAMTDGMAAAITATQLRSADTRPISRRLPGTILGGLL